MTLEKPISKDFYYTKSVPRFACYQEQDNVLLNNLPLTNMNNKEINLFCNTFTYIYRLYRKNVFMFIL